MLSPFVDAGDVLGHEPMGIVEDVGSAVYGIEYLRVPQAQYGPIKVPEGPPDERFVYLSDVLPTAWQAVEYAAVPTGGSLAVLGLGPIGQMCCRVARHHGTRSSVSTWWPSG